MSKLMRSISGIRGIVGDTLTPQVLKSHVRAFLEITKAKRVVIGRDSRPTGDAIVQFVATRQRAMADYTTTPLELWYNINYG